MEQTYYPVRDRRRRLAKSVSLIGALGLAAATLVSCSAGAPADVAPSSDMGTDFAGAVAAAAERIDGLKDPIDSFEFDAADLPAGSADLTGKTIMVIPLASVIFSTMISSIEDAFEATGAEIVVCDGQAQPTEISNCMYNAITTGVDGVLTIAVSPSIASAGYEQLRDAGIVTLGGWQNSEGYEESDTLRFVDSANAIETALERSIDFSIASAESPRSLLLIDNNDSDSTIRIGDSVATYFSEVCPGCAIAEVGSTTALAPEVAGDISAKLLTDPEVDTIIGFNLDTLGTAINDGIASAGTVSPADMFITGQAGSMQALQLLGKGSISGVVMQSSDYTAWVITDAFVRLQAGGAPAEYPSVLRLFDSSNISEITVTAENASGFGWFGEPVFQDVFKASWGV